MIITSCRVLPKEYDYIPINGDLVAGVDTLSLSVEMQESLKTRDLFFICRIDNSKCSDGNLLFSIKLTSPQGDIFRDTLDLPVSGSNSDIKYKSVIGDYMTDIEWRYATDLIPVEYGKWLIDVTPVKDLDDCIFGFGISYRESKKNERKR